MLNVKSVGVSTTEDVDGNRPDEENDLDPKVLDLNAEQFPTRQAAEEYLAGKFQAYPSLDPYFQRKLEETPPEQIDRRWALERILASSSKPFYIEQISGENALRLRLRAKAPAGHQWRVTVSAGNKAKLTSMGGENNADGSVSFTIAANTQPTLIILVTTKKSGEGSLDIDYVQDDLNADPIIPPTVTGSRSQPIELKGTEDAE